MARYGFIHDKLDIKFLILYFMARVAAPIDFPTLTELTVCDDGIGYFEFAEAVSELVESGHLTLEDGLYSITEKGRENGAACESSLPYSVKRNCSAQLVKLNGILRRNAQVRAETEPRPEGGYSARMFLDDDGGNLFTLELFCGSQEQANRLAESFKAEPERIYNEVLSALLEGLKRNKAAPCGGRPYFVTAAGPAPAEWSGRGGVSRSGRGTAPASPAGCGTAC